MIIESTKVKLDNMLANYNVYDDDDWLNVLIKRISHDNMDREFLMNCKNPENNISYYIKDPDIVRLLTMILLCKPYKFEEPNILFENGLTLNLELMDTTIIYPYLIINGDIAIDTTKNDTITEYLGLAKYKSNIVFVEDNIPNNDYWKHLVNRTSLDADDSKGLVQLLKTHKEDLTSIRNYYTNNIDKTVVQCKGDTITIFNGTNEYMLSTYEFTDLDPQVGSYYLEWFGNDLWFFDDDHNFVFALNKLDALTAFHFATSVATPYNVIENPRVLARCEKHIEEKNYVKLQDGLILNRNLYCEGLDKPRRVVSKYTFNNSDNIYNLYYSHNMVIAETEVENGRHTSPDI